MKFILLNLIVPLFLIAQSESAANIEALLSAGQYQDAQFQIQEALAGSPTDTDLMLLGAKVAVRLDDLNAAREFMVTANEIAPSDQEILDYWNELKDLGDLISESRKTIDSGFLDEALMSLDSTNVKFPDFALAYYMKGMVFYKQNDFEQAVQNFKSAVALNPFNEDYKNGIANIGREMYNLGNEWMRRKDYNQALGFYQNAIDYYPELTDSYFRIAYAYYKLDRLNEAEENLQILVGADDTHSKSRKLLGDVYSKLSQSESALKWYKNATEVDPNYYQAFYALGKLLVRAGKIDEAIIELEKTVEINPDYSIAYELLGSIYQDRGNIDSAILNYQQAVMFDKKAYSSNWRLSVCYNELKDFSNARKYAKQSLDIKSNYAAAYFELGMAEKCLGNKAAAVDAFNKAKTDSEWRKSVEFQLKNIDKPC